MRGLCAARLDPDQKRPSTFCRMAACKSDQLDHFTFFPPASRQADVSKRAH